MWDNETFAIGDAGYVRDLQIAKEQGFVFDSAAALWRGDAEALRKLGIHRVQLQEPMTISKVAAEHYRAAGQKILTAIEESRAENSDILIPVPGGLNPQTEKPYAFLPYQRAGIAYALKRPCTLVGDEPGLGKTMQAIGFSNCLSTASDIVIVCPGTLKPMWKEKFMEWDVKRLTVGIASGVTEKTRAWPDTDVVIMNYDIVYAHLDKLAERNWQIRIVDEAHRLKSKKARRTKAVFSVNAERSIYLSGTPSLNGKPIEMWPLLEQIDPNGLGKDWWDFATKYCKLTEVVVDQFNKPRCVAFWAGDRRAKNEKHQCWLTDGATRLEEMQGIMRQRFMVRRLKADVMKDLPAKRRMIIPIEVSAKDAKHFAKEIMEFEKFSGKSADELYDMPGFGEFSTEMLEAGLKMVKPTVEIAEDDLEEMEVKKLVIMCYHKEVANQICEELKGLLVTGDVAVSKRYDLCKRFQVEPDLHVLVGTIDACSEGLEMFAASEMIFPERGWTPGSVTQAEDRIHRMGQKGSCLYKHLVLQHSLQERQTRALIRKQDQADRMLDKQ